MLNIQKYEKEIATCGIDNFAMIDGDIYHCWGTKCDSCDFDEGECSTQRLEWLLEGELETTDKVNELTETNYDHYRQEIEEIGLTDLAMRKDDGVIFDCEDFGDNCSGCYFFEGEHCAEKKLEWLEKPYKEIYKYSDAEFTLLRILQEGTLHRNINGNLVYTSKYSDEIEIPDDWNGLNFSNIEYDENGENVMNVERMMQEAWEC